MFNTKKQMRSVVLVAVLAFTAVSPSDFSIKERCAAVKAVVCKKSEAACTKIKELWRHRHRNKALCSLFVVVAGGLAYYNRSAIVHFFSKTAKPPTQSPGAVNLDVRKVVVLVPRPPVVPPAVNATLVQQPDREVDEQPRENRESVEPPVQETKNGSGFFERWKCGEQYLTNLCGGHPGKAIAAVIVTGAICVCLGQQCWR